MFYMCATSIMFSLSWCKLGATWQYNVTSFLVHIILGSLAGHFLLKSCKMTKGTLYKTPYESFG